MTNSKFDVLVPSLSYLNDYLKEQILTEAKYFRYVEKQQKQIEKMKKMLDLKIPDDFIYDKLPGLSTEIIQKLSISKPKTLFNASQISGITPSAIDILHLNINARKK